MIDLEETLLLLSIQELIVLWELQIVLRLCSHLHCSYVCIGVARLLALQWRCTWVAPMSECFVFPSFRRRRFRRICVCFGTYLLWCAWADVGFDFDFGFRLRLHCLELHRHESRCFERTAVALDCIAVA